MVSRSGAGIMTGAGIQPVAAKFANSSAGGGLPQPRGTAMSLGEGRDSGTSLEDKSGHLRKLALLVKQEKGWGRKLVAAQHGVQVSIFGVGNSLQVLTMGALRPLHRSSVQLMSLLASMNLLSSVHHLPDLAAKHNALFREPWRVPCSILTAPKIILLVMSGLPAADHSRKPAFSRSFSTIACSNWPWRSELAFRAAT